MVPETTRQTGHLRAIRLVPCAIGLAERLRERLKPTQGQSRFMMISRYMCKTPQTPPLCRTSEPQLSRKKTIEERLLTQLPKSDPTQCWEALETIFHEAIDTNIPTRRHKPRKPWIKPDTLTPIETKVGHENKATLLGLRDSSSQSQ